MRARVHTNVQGTADLTFSRGAQSTNVRLPERHPTAVAASRSRPARAAKGRAESVQRPEMPRPNSQTQHGLWSITVRHGVLARMTKFGCWCC